MRIVLLGGGIQPDGQLPPQDFIQQRLRRTKELYDELQIPIIISGGHSFLLDIPPPRSEAAALQEALVGMGVPASAIQLEEQSQDTISNAYFVKQLLKEERELVVVTSDFHRERVDYIFKHVLGLEYQVRVEGTPSNLPSKQAEHIVARQTELLKKTHQLFAGMKPGDDAFLSDKFFTDPYYTEERPDWVKQFVAKGK